MSKWITGVTLIALGMSTEMAVAQSGCPCPGGNTYSPGGTAYQGSAQASGTAYQGSAQAMGATMPSSSMQNYQRFSYSPSQGTAMPQSSMAVGQPNVSNAVGTTQQGYQRFSYEPQAYSQSYPSASSQLAYPMTDESTSSGGAYRFQGNANVTSGSSRGDRPWQYARADPRKYRRR